MKVLHAISSIDPIHGGPTTALIGLTRAQVAVGMQVKVFATWCPPTDVGPSVEIFRASGVDVATLGPCNPRRSTHPMVTRTTIDEVRNADVVHIHGLWEEVQHYAAVGARKYGKPYLIRPCGLLDPWSLKQGALKKKLYLALRLRKDLKRAAAIHCTTAIEAEHVGLLKLGTPALIEPNGINLSEYATLPAPGTFRLRYPQLEGKKLALFLSRIHLKKGIDLLVPAFARAKVDNAMLVVAGNNEGGYETEIRRLVKENGIEDRVLFVGELRGADKVAAFTDADLFTLTSYTENFGIVVAEALASGTPVLISDGVALHPDVTAARVGGVVPLDIDQIASSLRRWLTDDVLRSDAASRARAFVQSRFDWNEIARRWKDHYASIIASGG